MESVTLASPSPAQPVDSPPRAGAPSGREQPSFTICAQGPKEAALLERGDLYRAALAFLDGRIQVRGDLVAALRAAQARQPRGWFRLLARLAAWAEPLRPERWWQSRARARANIEHHYDHPTEFYRQFLDARMVYSCAYFEDPQWPLDTAQLAKLDLICRKLELRPGDRFLDVGCGWGALVARAAEAYGAHATGCTLSRRQFDAASSMIAGLGAGVQASILYLDYRDLQASFDKIASVGMFEHVGVRRLGEYFRQMEALLRHDGRFLNHGLARPESVRPGVAWRFVQREVFPGGDLPPLSGVIHQAEQAGFEVLDVENLRPHYALTCRAWVERLQARQDVCLRLVPARVYRTWLLYLAASAANFEDGFTDVYQILMAKRRCPWPRHYHRRHMFPSPGAAGSRQ